MGGVKNDSIKARAQYILAAVDLSFITGIVLVISEPKVS